MISRLVLAAIAGVLVSLSGPAFASAATTTGTASTLPIFTHVFVIVMENHEYSSIIGSSSAPYINGLAKTYANATQYYGVSHPSLPNYLALSAASTFGVTSDCTSCFQNQTNLADQIEASGRTFRAYMESMPSPCILGDSGQYAQRHNPWIYYDDIRTNATRCKADIVPYTQFATDVASSNPPNFMWITPNVCSDMHDCSVSTGDTWLAQNVPTILNSSAFKNGGVLFLVFDEGTTSAGCCTDAFGGHIPMLVISPLSIAGLSSTTAENHYSFVRTIEDSWGMPRLNSASCVCNPSMTEYFTQGPPPVIPEVPQAVWLPLAALILFGVALPLSRRRRSPSRSR
jgi:phospholipase C